MNVSVKGPEFDAEFLVAEGVAKVRFSGVIGSEDPSIELRPFFTEIHAKLLGSGAREVSIDWTGLEFMNSAGFKSFVRWIDEVRRMAPGERYHLLFNVNPRKRWQQTSVMAMRCFATELVELSPARAGM